MSKSIREAMSDIRGELKLIGKLLEDLKRTPAPEPREISVVMTQGNQGWTLPAWFVRNCYQGNLFYQSIRTNVADVTYSLSLTKIGPEELILDIKKPNGEIFRRSIVVEGK